MQKPTGYDEAKASGDFTPINLGGHYAVIKQVSERQSSTGKDMIVVLFDFAANDTQPDYFRKAFDDDTREEKKWPFGGSKYIMVNDYNDPSKTSRNFKTFCTCFEKSNDTQIKWGGASWAAQFKNKKIGVVYGEEEHEYDGKTSMRRVPKWFCTLDRVETASIPEPKYINGKAPVAAPTSTASDFMQVNSEEDEEIPF